MTFIKMLIGIPLLVVVLVFAFVNNDLATFSLWPFYVEITVSLSVAVVFLVAFGFLFGSLFTWLSYAPALREHKKKNKKLSKEQVKLTEKLTGLQADLSTLKPEVTTKSGVFSRIKNIFKPKQEETQTK